ncbi:MAG: MAPEG family protein [Thermodesulfobacteriota bacterium]
MSPTAFALAGFAGWFVLLTLVLGGFRSSLVLGGKREANAFRADGTDVPGFGQRLTRARDNVFENLPAFAALALAAQIAGRLDVTDPAAPLVLYARLGQTVTHLISVSPTAVLVRFAFYLVQVAIFAWWALRLLQAG